MSTTPLSGTVTPSGSQLERPFTWIPESNVYVSYPSKTVVDTATSNGQRKDDPTVILIFGWMGAQLPHLYKYTEQYNKLYPFATQIMVRAHAKYFWGSETTRRAAVSPVIKLLRDAGIHENTMAESSGLLVHAFSNGGALNVTTLARAIADSRTSASNTSAIPARALIYDSLPGVLNIRVTLLAFTAAIRSPAFRAIAKFFLGILYIMGTVWKYLEALVFGPKEDLVTKLHRELNEPKLLPQHIPRAYMYSEVDELIPASSVEGHAKKAKELTGGDTGVVRLVKFQGSPHVAHARQDPERYWDTVVKTWESSFSKQ
ncbi:putative indole-diterpene biosynthesis protein PaxU [Rhizoctonia solani 123E]|uniref:Putative indole-diterpene biosynthesis protein PaxU n=1 Tax=Rhizoctonia solani 123E TaxID=1423351 RepID=A0A074RZ90_9AGAM|nr:putative indole-diterpene biosynthesis protein PaxU [Rhizoctonia solani 123E]